jgi:hypothetical protein
MVSVQTPAQRSPLRLILRNSSVADKIICPAEARKLASRPFQRTVVAFWNA